MLGTVTRAGDVLDLFDASAPEWGASAVARRLDIGKSQAHEVLMSLANIGLLRKSGRGRYRLGWRTLMLGNHLLQSELYPAVGSLMAQLAHSMEADVRLDALERGRLITVARRRSRRPGAIAEPPSRSIRASASGRLLLTTIDDLGSMAPFVFDRDEPEIGSRGLAVPVYDCVGGVLALGATISAAHWPSRRDALLRATTGVAARMTRSLAQPDDVRPAQTGRERQAA